VVLVWRAWPMSFSATMVRSSGCQCLSLAAMVRGQSISTKRGRRVR
jgi:hypothetical protein